MGVVFVFGNGSFVGEVDPIFGVVVMALVGDAEYRPLHACGYDA